MKYTNIMTGKGSFSLAVSDKNIVIYLNISIHYEMQFLVWLKNNLSSNPNWAGTFSLTEIIPVLFLQYLDVAVGLWITLKYY